MAKNHNPPPSPPGRGARGVGEDLNVSGMMSNHKLAKAVADIGFYEFRRQLEYKCQLYGSKLTIVDRWFPMGIFSDNFKALRPITKAAAVPLLRPYLAI
ncbi:hypothetical protein [Okeania sp. SIO3B5]|uniref:hypothetical protein n=1 Tax=Okeania sp. SIO3B5 TaxID=2607811 RepID=UPI0025CCB15F|nr:hypothetical protein [Okeania sp. SIO3B5]